MIRAGKLRHSITIQTPTEGTANAYNEKPLAWAEFAKVRTSVEPKGGREYYAAQQVHAEMTHLLTIRYLSGITPKMRVKLGTRYLYIVAISDLGERNREMQLVCKEEV